MPERMLELTNYHFYYGQIHAIKGISLHVNRGEIVSLIGGNGAGKTTTLRSISGLLGKGGSGERKEYPGRTLAEIIADEPWDYVSLQQASPLSGIYDSYAQGLPELHAYVSARVPEDAEIGDSVRVVSIDDVLYMVP